MSFPQNMEEAEAILAHAQAIKAAKSDLENKIYILLGQFEIETGFVVHDVYLNKSYGTAESVTVEVRV